VRRTAIVLVTVTGLVSSAPAWGAPAPPAIREGFTPLPAPPSSPPVRRRSASRAVTNRRSSGRTRGSTAWRRPRSRGSTPPEGGASRRASEPGSPSAGRAVRAWPTSTATDRSRRTPGD